jgi:hypothetical protein
MGYSVWCCRWWTITYDQLKELCEPEMAAVERHIFLGDEWLRLAAEDLTPDDKPFISAVAALEKRFTEATGGLTLVFLPYDADMDDCRAAARDREWEGILFGVDGVEDFTPAGSRFKDMLVDTKWIEAG